MNSFLGKVIGELLPNDEGPFRAGIDHSGSAEYTGPRYDSPEMIAEVRQKLGLDAETTGTGIFKRLVSFVFYKS